jgi:hypothetical protein
MESVNMSRQRNGAAIQEFSGPLWDDPAREFAPTPVLEELVKASWENPDYFSEEWVNPLVAEGLDLDRIFDLLLTGTAQPN